MQFPDAFSKFVAPIVLCWALLTPAAASASAWTVTITAHSIEALTNTDAWDEQDMYWRVHMKPAIGSGQNVDCDTEDNHPDDDNTIKPNWACVITVAGGPDTMVEIALEVLDEDVTSGDDELDLNIDHAQLGLLMRFEPRTSKLEIVGDPRFTPARCAPDRVKASGFGGGGDEPAEIVFSVSASPASAVDGDSDGDGISDTAEICGVDGNGDGVADVDLPAMGADPARKDVFAEIDWMSAPGGATAHSHEPWLPALINAWNEFNVAPVTNPTIAGAVKAGGIALHLDVGTLYSNYGFDDDGNGTPELPAGGPVPSGDIDLDGNGIPDIGNLGLLGIGLRPGGNVLAEDAVLGPPTSVTGTPTAAQIFGPGSDFAAIKAANFDPARDTTFHYVVFAHAYQQVVGGPAGSSGLAEPCVSDDPCNELIVSLGGYGRQTVDKDRNGIPDTAPPPPAPPSPPPPLVIGPTGIPVDGLVGDHVGTFMHELGHNFGLQHGGSDSVNWKPNFLSIENYYWQLPGLSYDWNGDSLGDAVGLDFDGNGTTDLRRYQYSSFAGSPPMPALNEGATAPPAVVSETTAPAAWSRLLTQYTCPSPPAGPGVANPTAPIVPIFQPVNWDCKPGASAPVDIDNVAFASGGVPEILNSFDDYNLLANGGLDTEPGSGIGLQEKKDLDAASQRIIEPRGREEFINQCRDLRRIDFDDQRRGTVITNQYALIFFVADATRTPMVAAPGDRNNVATASPDKSLINRSRGGAITPLSFSFSEPQRVVQLRLGQAGLASSPSELMHAVVEAFDGSGVSMGRIVKPLPSPALGITTMVTAAAVFPDQLIHRMEVRYEVGYFTTSKLVYAPLAEPVQIDDLYFCGRLDDTNAKPTYPPPPKWGELPAELQIHSEALMEVAGTGEPGNTATIPWAFTGLSVKVDGIPMITNAKLARPEGSALKIVAPLTSSVGPFLYWRYGSGISFGRGVNTIPLTLLRNGVVTAVYQGRRYERPPPRQDDSQYPGIEWLRRCILTDCLRLFRVE